MAQAPVPSGFQTVPAEVKGMIVEKVSLLTTKAVCLVFSKDLESPCFKWHLLLPDFNV